MKSNESNGGNSPKTIFLKIEHLNLCIELDKIALNQIWDKESWEKEELMRNIE